VRAGFIGLGDQGGPIARRIAAAGIPTNVWARRREVADVFSAVGASICDSPAAVGAASDVVGICVFDADAVEQVVFGPSGVAAGMGPGGVIAVHSTVSPDQIRSVARRCASAGITVLDAPVSGGGRAAAEGRLLVILAGPNDACDTALPVLSTFANPILRLREVGAGQAAKLLNNALFAANVALVYDAVELGKQFGIATGLLDVLRQASARSFAADVAAGAGHADALLAGQFGPTIRKDLALLGGLGPAGQHSAVLEIAAAFTQRPGAHASQAFAGAGSVAGSPTGEDPA
jgi:3-hydroxyisobutyrate dehydrogenase